jgi:predicted AlkP superfamily phosphohydrolase/phosphomutase
MRYLRMLSNSIAAGCLATAYVLTLVLQLNPALPLDQARLAPLATTVGLFYAVHFAVIWYVLLVVRQLAAREVFSPAWLSVGVLLWLGALAAAGGSALMWANLYTFARVLDAETVTAMTRGAGALILASIAFMLVAWVRRAFGREARWFCAGALLLIAGVSIAVPLTLRGPGKIQPLEARSLSIATDFTLPGRGSRVNVIAIDGASLDFIVRATAEGRLPNFGRVLDSGAVMRLATIHPTSAEAVWAAALTGKLPLKNGVRSAGIYHLASGGAALQLLPNHCFAYQLVRFGFLVDEPHTSATLRTRALWNILSTYGFSVGAVGWPLTQPAPAVRGYVVSDTYLSLVGTPSGVVDSPAVYPPDVQGDVAQAIENLSAETPPIVLASTAPLEDRHVSAGRTDRIYDRVARELAQLRQPQVTLTRYQSLDPIGHYFLRYAMPSEFGDALDDEHRTLGAVLERHYKLIDDAIGRAIAALGPDDVMLVVSGFGMEPMGLWKRLVEGVIGDPDLNGTHDAAPDGFVMAYGASVARGRLATRASVVDVTPTILYFLGLPIGRDMDGYARTDLFQRAFTDERPITFIPTYDR